MSTKTRKEHRGYSNKTIKKVVFLLKMWLKFYKLLPYNKLKVHISKGNTKIGKTHNFSLPPILSCSNCSGCSHFCYDISSCLRYENVQKARTENLAMMQKDMTKTFELIDIYISTRRANKYFRWHVAGDILNYDYFCNMVEIAKKHPDWLFWTYTKVYGIVNLYCDINGKDAIPDNFSIMFSRWNGMPMSNPYNFAEFTCIQEGMNIPENQWKCPGKCDICINAKRGCPVNENAYVFEHGFD